MSGNYKVMLDRRAYEPYAPEADMATTDEWLYAGVWFTGEDVVLYPGEYVLLGPQGTCTDPATGDERDNEGDHCG